MDESFIKNEISLDEKSMDYLYLDSVNCVTIGVGIMFPNVQQLLAANLRFYKVDNSAELATEDEILQAWNKVNEYSGRNLAATSYKNKTNIRANSSALTDLYNVRFSNAIIDAKKYFNNGNTTLKKGTKFLLFDTLPDGVQYALIDMSFNLGYPRLKKYKNLRTHLRDGDFYKAAKASHRNGIPIERNKKIYKWIEDEAKKQPVNIVPVSFKENNSIYNKLIEYSSLVKNWRF